MQLWFRILITLDGISEHRFVLRTIIEHGPILQQRLLQYRNKRKLRTLLSGKTFSLKFWTYLAHKQIKNMFFVWAQSLIEQASVRILTRPRTLDNRWFKVIVIEFCRWIFFSFNPTRNTSSGCRPTGLTQELKKLPVKIGNLKIYTGKTPMIFS